MKKNMGTRDRVMRILAALGIVVLYATGNVSGLLAIVLGVVAVVFLTTGLVGSCPAYVPFGISTRHEPAKPAHV
jgi:hypothetical protein